jgi:osmoprotectant transport system substrate-binding protein
MRRTLALVLVAALCVGAAACTRSSEDGGTGSGDRGSDGVIVVGVSGAFTENQLVAEMYAQVLHHAGYDVERQLNLRSRESSQSALESGEIDVKPEYLSSLLLFVDPGATPSSDPGETADELRRVLSPKGLAVLTPAPAEDTNEFVANPRTAERYGLTTMSSLARVADQLTLGAPPECPQRPLCLPGLHDRYGILFRDFVPLDVGGPETVEALKTDRVQVGLLFSTDPTIEANGFVRLEDDKHLQNAENITPVIRVDALDGRVRAMLNDVSARLTSPIVTRLVGKVVLDGQDVPAVAERFLQAQGLV